MIFANKFPTGLSPHAESDVEKSTPLFEPFLHSNNGRRVLRSLGLIQHSMVNPFPAPTSRLAEAATTTAPVPAKLNACPTSPGLKPTLAVPELLPTMSLPLPSPGHQLTKPDGGFMHEAISRTGRSKTTDAKASIAIMYRFINRLSSFFPNTVTSLNFPFRISWAYRSGPFITSSRSRPTFFPFEKNHCLLRLSNKMP